MNTFFTADHHFNHKRIIEYSSRPFKDVDEMNEVLIRKWNEKIKPKDTVYHLGDFAFGNPGNKIMILNRLKRRIVKFFIILLFLPFVFLAACLLVLPFFLPLFLIKGFHVFSLYIFIGLIIFLAIFLFFFTHRKSIAHYRTKRRAFLTAVGFVILAGFIVHTAFNLTSSWVLRQSVQKARAAGIKFKMEEVIPPMIPDESNAAIIYNRIFKLQDKLNEQYKELLQNIHLDFVSTPSFPLKETPAEQIAQARNLLLKNSEFILLFSMVEDAVAMPECRFPMNYEAGWAMQYPHLSKLISLTKLLALRTYLLCQHGNYNSAWRSFKTSFEVEKALENEPLLVSQLSRFSIHTIAVNNFQTVFSKMREKITTEDYRNLIDTIDGKEKTLIETWKNTPGFTCEYIYGDIFSTGYRIKYHPSMLERILSAKRFWRIYQGYFFRPILKRDAAFYISSHIKACDLFALPYYKVAKKARTMDEEIKKNRPRYLAAGMGFDGCSYFDRWCVNLNWSHFHRMHQIQSEYIARLDSLKITCALEIYRKEYGHYPEAFEQIVPAVLKGLPLDPFTGKNYIYRRENGGFIVYSTGPNQIDDGGIKDLRAGKDDIAWHYKK
jgi:hypothetical protein